MSLRQALKSKFRPEKSELEKEADTPPSSTVIGPTFLEDDMCLSHEDILLSDECIHPDRECAQDSCRACYEAQLNQLQEQLVATMLENQQLLMELKELREQQTLEEVVKQLEKEKEKTKILSERLSEKETKDSSGSKSPRLRRFVRKDKHAEKSKSIDATMTLTATQEKEEWVDVAKEVTEEDKELHVETPTGSQPSLDADFRWHSKLKSRIYNWFYEFLDDFTETCNEEEERKEGDEGDPLTVRKLKENIMRFGNATKPISNAVDDFTSLIRWKSQGTTLLAFSVYMYTVYHGWFIPLALFLANCQLLLNYIRTRGWFTSIHSIRKSDQYDPERDMGVSDKFQLVLHVARKAQNKSGRIADCCEKIKNCLLWEQADVTAQIFVLLLAAFFASCVFPAKQLFTTAGLYLGVKLFIVDYIFYRFPRVQQKYDSTLRMWRSLPTNAELERRHNRAEINKNVLNHGNVGDSSNTTEYHSFCELFNLPASETPLPSWHSGRRCTLINRDKSLTSAFKNGRLYLTNSFLCFERSKTSTMKNLVLPLKNICKVEKAKPYPWIPGGGMALEVHLDKPEKQAYIFGAMMNRDEVFESLMEVGLKAGLPWASPLTETAEDASRKQHKPATEV